MTEYAYALKWDLYFVGSQEPLNLRTRRWMAVSSTRHLTPRLIWAQAREERP